MASSKDAALILAERCKAEMEEVVEQGALDLETVDLAEVVVKLH